jgi:hypothetical protein
MNPATGVPSIGPTPGLAVDGFTAFAGAGEVFECYPSGCHSFATLHGFAVATDSVSVYAADHGVRKCPLAGCPGGISVGVAGAGLPTSSSLAPYGLAVDATSVYWVDTSSNSIFKVPK